MKAWKLLLLSLVPGAVGYLVNLLLLIPRLGMALFYLMPWAMAVFCFRLGLRCGRRGPSFPRALALTQWPSAVSFTLYVWQFHFVSGEARNSFLSLLGQLPSTPLLPAADWLVLPFAQRLWGPAASLAATALSLLLLAALFSAGYWRGRTGAPPAGS